MNFCIQMNFRGRLSAWHCTQGFSALGCSTLCDRGQSHIPESMPLVPLKRLAREGRSPRQTTTSLDTLLLRTWSSHNTECCLSITPPPGQSEAVWQPGALLIKGNLIHQHNQYHLGGRSKSRPQTPGPRVICVHRKFEQHRCAEGKPPMDYINFSKNVNALD